MTNNFHFGSVFMFEGNLVAFMEWGYYIPSMRHTREFVTDQ